MKAERIRKMAEIYSRDTKTAFVVAEICDEILDRTGGLLGEVRSIARRDFITKTKRDENI
jgi:hypothetical protein